MHVTPRLLPCLMLCVAAALPAPAASQVQRCMGPDGRAVYTDRRCDDVGAVERLPGPSAAEAPRLFRGGCPRVLSQLVGEIGAAIQGRDVNRLAGIYDWRGVSDASASRLLDRLEAVVERPLVDIAPVYAESPVLPLPPLPAPPPATTAATHDDPRARPEQAGGPSAWMPSWSTGQPGEAQPPATAMPLPPDAAPAVLSPSRPRPVALRIEQTLAGSATPARTVFGLRRGYGCFWITL
ncbi:hypothetical protein [Pseudoxanthomonas sp. 10H]|uniref:hypothetical protein n=1 Tax=Pseudoxanthomonas sp. 10H TaxID=3242729 RepID=UPI003556F165